MIPQTAEEKIKEFIELRQLRVDVCPICSNKIICKKCGVNTFDEYLYINLTEIEDLLSLKEQEVMNKFNEAIKLSAFGCYYDQGFEEGKKQAIQAERARIFGGELEFLRSMLYLTKDKKVGLFPNAQTMVENRLKELTSKINNHSQQEQMDKLSDGVEVSFKSNQGNVRGLNVVEKGNCIPLKPNSHTPADTHNKEGDKEK